MSKRNNSVGLRWLSVILVGAAALIGSMMPAIAGGARTRIDATELERVRGSNFASNPIQSSCDSKNLNNACAAAGGACVSCSAAGYDVVDKTKAGTKATEAGGAQSCGSNVSGSCAADPIKAGTFFCDNTANGQVVGQCQAPPNSPAGQGPSKGSNQ